MFAGLQKIQNSPINSEQEEKLDDDFGGNSKNSNFSQFQSPREFEFAAVDADAATSNGAASR